MGPEPGSDAHGLVGARVALARGRLAVASLLHRRGDVASTIAAAVVPASHCCCAVAVMSLASPSPPTLSRSCRSDTAAVAVTSRTSQSRRCYGVAVAPTIAAAVDALPSRRRRVAVVLPLRRRALTVVVWRPQCLGWGRSPGTDAHGFVGALVSLLAVAASLSRRQRALAESLRVRASCRPVLPCRPCRSPLASRPRWQSRWSRHRLPYSSAFCRPRLRSPFGVVVSIVVGIVVGGVVAGGDVIVRGVVRHRCGRRLVNSRASGRPRYVRAPRGGGHRRAP